MYSYDVHLNPDKYSGIARFERWINQLPNTGQITRNLYETGYCWSVLVEDAKTRHRRVAEALRHCFEEKVRGPHTDSHTDNLVVVWVHFRVDHIDVLFEEVSLSAAVTKVGCTFLRHHISRVHPWEDS